MRKSVAKYKDIGHIDLPAELADDVVALLWDPRFGRIRYGALRRLCFKLFSNWVEEQRTTRSIQADPGPLPDLEDL